jgi:hypothetical protein
MWPPERLSGFLSIYDSFPWYIQPGLKRILELAPGKHSPLWKRGVGGDFSEGFAKQEILENFRTFHFDR